MPEPTLDTLTRCLDRLKRQSPGWFGSAVVGVVTVFRVAGASLAENGTAEVARTWEEARVFLPGSAVPLTPPKVPAPDHPLPTVLYLTGCTGFDYSHDGTMGGWAQTLTAAGYAVVMPTSYAREYRPHACDQATYAYTLGLAVEVSDMRQEEIKYALTQLRTLSWVDRRNLFLMGHSEGGAAVARWGGGEFNGHIISGWTCTAPPYPSLDALQAPLATPVLAIAFESDPWFRGPFAGSCASRFGTRKDARQVTLPGSGHNTASYAEARTAVLQFLRDHTVR
jgi:dienelactone hydrolase